MELPKRRGLTLTIIGAICMVLLAPAAAGIGIWQGVSHGMSAVNDQPWVSPGGVVHVTDHARQTILVEGYYAADEPLPSCRVIGPSGATTTVDTSVARLHMDWSGTSLTRAGTFRPLATGDYQITCSDVRTKVLASSIADDITRRVLVPLGVGLAVAVVVFLIGLVLLIIGILKLVNSGRERSRARIAMAGGYPGQQWYGGSPPGAGPPYGNQPPYGKQPGQQPGDPDDPYGR
jgi:hypothetical protein